MNVTCPQCNTVYRLPDEKVKPGAKLRCSVCRHIFTLSAEERAEPPVEGSLTLGGESKGRNRSHNDGLELGGASPEKRSSASYEGGLSLGGSRNASLGGGLELSMDEPRDGRHTLPEERSSQGLRLDGDSAASFGGLDMPRKKRSILPRVTSFLVCVALAAGCGWMWQNTHYLDGVKGLVAPYFGWDMADPSDPVSLVSELELRDVRQYQVKNEKAGNLVIIEGKVKNNFPAPREFIKLEAELYDANGNKLVSQQQLAGNSMSSFQLELLDKDELDKVLNNKLDIVEANTNVLPGNEVPFTVIFVNPPAEASDYKVRIVEASIPKGPGNLTE
ncbi:DUF3426 domain-containing protein [Mailhella sp.]|uniref:DUF3426 domain-containing protein n=1 Tax=Mailhella sp. TaxID=1981029 RepID=UPI003AB872E7